MQSSQRHLQAARTLAAIAIAGLALAGCGGGDSSTGTAPLQIFTATPDTAKGDLQIISPGTVQDSGVSDAHGRWNPVGGPHDYCRVTASGLRNSGDKQNYSIVVVGSLADRSLSSVVMSSPGFEVSAFGPSTRFSVDTAKRTINFDRLQLNGTGQAASLFGPLDYPNQSLTIGRPTCG